MSDGIEVMSCWAPLSVPQLLRLTRAKHNPHGIGLPLTPYDILKWIHAIILSTQVSPQNGPLPHPPRH